MAYNESTNYIDEAAQERTLLEKERYDMSKEELRDLLIKEAWEGLKNSYSPYSKFPV